MPRVAIRNPGEFWSGVILAGFGVGFALLGLGYEVGRPTRMGPGFLPSVLAVGLALIGLVTAARGVLRVGPPATDVAWRPMALVLGATILFGVLLQGAGLAAALFATILVSARASLRFRWRSAILLAGAVGAGAILVFAYALRLPVPVVGPWLGG